MSDENTGSVKNVLEYDGLNLELFFGTEVLKLRSLHYGYFEAKRPVEDLTLADFRRAQERYTEELVSHIPEGVTSILDVGSGIGDNALALANRGYAVTALSPDKNHKHFYDALTGKGVAFVNERFEDLSIEQRFDLILMSESQNYFDAGIGFRQCRRYMNSGGFLLVLGIFRTSDSREFNDINNIEDGYINRAKLHGFPLVSSLDITEKVLPTVELIQRGYREYVSPLMAGIAHYVQASMPLKLRLLRLVFGRQFREFLRLRAYYEERMSPELFQTHLKYLVLLFRESAS